MNTFKPTEHLLDQPESHQPHYDKDDRVQPIDIIEQYGLDFYEASALKYLLRYKEKNGVEDLKKLQQYVHWLVRRLEQRNTRKLLNATEEGILQYGPSNLNELLEYLEAYLGLYGADSVARSLREGSRAAFSIPYYIHKVLLKETPKVGCTS